MISELSAIDAPTRPLWLLLGTVYSVLMIAFGWGVWTSSPHRRIPRVLGILLIIHGGFSAYWPPMHQRAALAAGGRTLTDTLHIVWTAVTGLLFLFEAALGAAAFGKRFRVYSVVSLVIALAAGAVTGTYTSDLEANLPTPWAGVWERIGAGVYMLWIAVLAIAVLRAPTEEIGHTAPNVSTSFIADGGASSLAIPGTRGMLTARQTKRLQRL